MCIRDSEAASHAREDSSIYCIANSHAVEIFGLHAHEENIQDRTDNKTRFLVIGKMIEDKGKTNKTSVMINIQDEPGSLMKIQQHSIRTMAEAL